MILYIWTMHGQYLLKQDSSKYPRFASAFAILLAVFYAKFNIEVVSS